MRDKLEGEIRRLHDFNRDLRGTWPVLWSPLGPFLLLPAWGSPLYHGGGALRQAASGSGQLLVPCEPAAEGDPLWCQVRRSPLVLEWFH